MATTEMKVLTPALANSLCEFNSAARALQNMGVKIAGFFPRENRLEITADGGHALLDAHLVTSFKRDPSAGSTHFSVLFQGVTLDWREAITYRNYKI